ncbi:MAG: histidine phosphatase family protein [Candidatus Methylacidiphilales bacterium]|nr:histidine phosphatase family protein [Candidatus Methylacidiphilales bacterium]
MKHPERVKQVFMTELASQLIALKGVISVTFTGSFIEREGLGSISDIDVIVITESLSSCLFNQCRDAASGISPELLGLSDYRIHLNDTFGPLKYDEPGLVVIHLMVYDRAGHCEHVLKSPFTCLDWERSPYVTGPSLRVIYPVLTLQLRHFMDARRSLSNYMNDLAKGTLSYRKYEFTENGYSEKVCDMPLDARHQGEYAYHIVKNLLGNYAKFFLKKNEVLSDTALTDLWKQKLPESSQYVDWFLALTAIKRTRSAAFPTGTVDTARDFIAAFSADLRTVWTQKAVRHVFVRHGRTALNDGSFLGQRRDPDIAELPGALPDMPVRVMCSPALRCRSTAAALAPNVACQVDNRLAEIDYGLAEGLRYSQLAENFPHLVEAWARGEDPHFPDGENTATVATRLQNFLEELGDVPTLVVTHNVVLRILVGGALSLPSNVWHWIPVSHLEPIVILRNEGMTYLDLTSEQTVRITDAVAPYLS